ncbi:MAG: hypothetical protein HY791_39790 [Deltaproteobacteria bacterium]|nr:hypothetical protein [Deltaproteobacteria bacterium]
MRAGAAALLALVACSEELTLAPDAPAGSLVFLFALDAQNQPTRVEKLRVPIEIELAEGERVGLGWLAPIDLALPSGEQLSQVEVDALVPHLARDRGGSCGRCLAPTLSSPMLLFPGDSCPLPPFMHSSLVSSDGQKSAESASVFEILKSSVFIDVPGQCACPWPEPHFEPSSIEVTPLAPEQPFILGSGTLAADGTALLFGSGKAVRVDPSRAVVVGDAPVLEGGIATFLGHTSSVVLVSGRADQRGSFLDFVSVIDDELRPGRRVETTLLVEDIHFDGTDIILAGGSKEGTSSSQTAGLGFCPSQGGPCRDVLLPPPCGRTSIKSLIPSHHLAVGGERLISYGADGARCAARISEQASLPNGPVKIVETTHAAAFGDRVFACSNANLGSDPGQLVFTFELDADSVDPSKISHARAVRFERVRACMAIIPESEESALVVFNDRTSLRVSADAVLEEYASLGEGQAPTLFSEAPEPIRLVERTPGGLLLRTETGAVYRRVRGGAIEPIYGPHADLPPVRATTVTNDGRLAAVTSDGVWIGSRPDAFEFRSFPSGGEGRGEAGPITKVVDDRATVVFQRGGKRSLWTLELDSLALSSPIGVPFSARKLVQLGRLGLLALDLEGVLHFMSNDGQISTLASSYPYSNIDESTGIAWAVGVNTITRILPGRGELRVETDYARRIRDTSPITDEGALPPVYSALNVRCPDVFEVGWRGDFVNPFSQHSSKVVRRLLLTSSPGHACADPPPENGLVSCVSGTPVENRSDIAAFAGGLDVSAGGAWISLSAAEIPYPLGAVLSIATSGNLSIAGGVSGRIGVIELR